MLFFLFDWLNAIFDISTSFLQIDKMALHL